jgi:hypothetical protein
VDVLRGSFDDPDELTEVEFEDGAGYYVDPVRAEHDSDGSSADAVLRRRTTDEIAQD